MSCVKATRRSQKAEMMLCIARIHGAVPHDDPLCRYKVFGAASNAFFILEIKMVIVDSPRAHLHVPRACTYRFDVIGWLTLLDGGCG